MTTQSGEGGRQAASPSDTHLISNNDPYGHAQMWCGAEFAPGTESIAETTCLLCLKAAKIYGEGATIRLAVIQDKQQSPDLGPCPWCPTERRQTYNTEGGLVGVITHDVGCFFAPHEDERRQILTPHGVEAWNTRVMAPSFEQQQLQGLYEDPHPGYDCRGTCVIHSGRFATPQDGGTP